MKEILWMEPVFKDMIWGGDKLSTLFQYEIPSDHTGECWAVSAHKNGDCRIASGIYAGQTLSGLWKEHRELFGNAVGDVFPLLIKIIDAKTDLSIQVHPDNGYAKEHENGSLGKTECWYILDCEEGATIVVGHNAQTKEELEQMIEEKRFLDLIQVRPIQKGDFFQITPGTVHAIKGGTVILETQQSSDITYRLYDYDRLSDGKPRELHLQKSMDVIQCPYTEVINTTQQMNTSDYDLEKLIQCEYYTVEKINVHGTFASIQDQPYQIISVVEGTGSIDGNPIQKGDHFILPSGYGDYIIEGTLEFMRVHS